MLEISCGSHTENNVQTNFVQSRNFVVSEWQRCSGVMLGCQRGGGASARAPAPGLQHQGPSTRAPAPGPQHQGPSTRAPAPGPQHQGPSTRAPVPGPQPFFLYWGPPQFLCIIHFVCTK